MLIGGLFLRFERIKAEISLLRRIMARAFDWVEAHCYKIRAENRIT